ncbi:CAMK/CAMKL/PASK protein kinase [Spizellomyces punctatus DAOM BR117]|uniref:CAMK/CAMKL/PASK protein kinase n=1 Tax=Spizellomyces punctatus (strain DAOM BR117) TaxID=645134 RepID=A0A0L0HQQ4_SPIPD|nr:CAMK/CAMKL/PASK protein kinase [Spizellomyces punctatus DAOM BR117]KND03398.1 CAMK/CAMKL/PASK protein kinase [Spizellomyces punctatus DAOM BR117]|eukprot:XP_016611437.1 CAMK/CAMKL/PASK protein kinase [Spizellomyces punctatus DAOM BR117]
MFDLHVPYVSSSMPLPFPQHQQAKREPLQARRLFTEAPQHHHHLLHHQHPQQQQHQQQQQQHSFSTHDSHSHYTLTSSSARKATNASIPPRVPISSRAKPSKLAVSTANLPPACPPPNKPLPPRPVAVPLQRYPYPQHVAQQLPPPKTKAQQAYPSPDPPTPADSMAERYLNRHQLNAAFVSMYTLGQELGSGGFGFVCSAVRKCDEREVACKFIVKSKVPAQGWARDAELGVVPMEVFMLKNIQHDNIITYLDFFEDMTFFYLITELHGAPWTSTRSDPSGESSAPPPTQTLTPITPTSFFPGERASGGMVSSGSAPASPPLSPMMIPKLTRRPSMDLFECIEQHDRLTESQARFVFRQIISAIKHLHSLGIVHRDIKDENILVDEHFCVKLIDFGSAAFVPQPTGKLFDRFLGTIQYASPEILRGEKYRGPEAEIWALGCCLYIMLNGEVPFTTPAQAAQHAYTFPKHRLSPQCMDLLDCMLEKRPSRRASIHDVAAHVWLNM